MGALEEEKDCVCIDIYPFQAEFSLKGQVWRKAKISRHYLLFRGYERKDRDLGVPFEVDEFNVSE